MKTAPHIASVEDVGDVRAAAGLPRYADILAASAATHYVLRCDGAEVAPEWVSQNVARLLGETVKSVVGQWNNFIERVHPDDRGEVLQNLTTVRAGKRLDHEYRLRHNHGHYRWVHDKVQAVANGSRGADFVIGSWIDVTERKEAADRFRQTAEKLRRTLIQTVGAMAQVVEERDPYTAGHQTRVADLATEIGREMGLSEDQNQGLRFGAMIHDIGKVGVPADLLARPSALNQAERELMQAHSAIGYRILKDIEFPWPVAEMARQHHERSDGSGYPSGLKGGAILLEARIIGVADVVEAMASHRPYRAALGIDAALAEINQCRGRLYDADVADACAALFRDGGYTLPDYRQSATSLW